MDNQSSQTKNLDFDLKQNDANISLKFNDDFEYFLKFDPRKTMI